MFLMVKKVLYGRDRFITLYCFHDEALQRRIEALPPDFKNWSNYNNTVVNRTGETVETFETSSKGLYQSLPCFIRDLLVNDNGVSMRETLYNDLLLKIAQNEEKDHIRPVQFVHEWGSVSYFLILSEYKDALYIISLILKDYGFL